MGNQIAIERNWDWKNNDRAVDRVDRWERPVQKLVTSDEMQTEFAIDHRVVVDVIKQHATLKSVPQQI